MKLPPSCRLLLLPVAAALTLLALRSRRPALPAATPATAAAAAVPGLTPRPGNATVPPRHPLQPPYPYPYRFVLNHPDKCRERAPFLVLLVATAPAELAARDAVRRTWGNESAVPGLSVLRLFLLGEPPAFGAELRPVLREEDELHGDLLQQDFLDTYNNLTLKTLMGLEWVTRFCPNATYVMKADHDVFLNLEFLARLLRPPRADFATGYVYRGTGPLRDRAYKWFVPRQVYPNDTYPPYCGGPGYVLSAGLARRVLAAAQALPPINMEDAFVGICLHALGVAVTEPPPGTFHMFRLEYERCRFSRLALVHHYGPRELLRLWPHFHGAAEKCP